MTDLSSANGTLTSDGSQVVTITRGLVLFFLFPTFSCPLQVTKMATGGSVRLRDKATLFIGDVECDPMPNITTAFPLPFFAGAPCC